MTALRLILSASGLIILAAAAIAFSPLQTPQTLIRQADHTAVRRQQNTVRLQPLAAHFDRSNLPDRIVSPVATIETTPDPAPDPANALRRHRYIGMADSDGRKAAVFENAGATQILKPGERLEGFTLAAFDAKNARFELEELEVHLSLTKR